MEIEAEVLVIISLRISFSIKKAPPLSRAGLFVSLSPDGSSATESSISEKRDTLLIHLPSLFENHLTL
jgi:hypothetical protein